MSSIGPAVVLIRTDRSVLFEAEVIGLPIGTEDIAKAQEDAGYSPIGYGGPWILDYDRDDSRKPLRVRWTCAGSCD